MQQAGNNGKNHLGILPVLCKHVILRQARKPTCTFFIFHHALCSCVPILTFWEAGGRAYVCLNMGGRNVCVLNTEDKCTHSCSHAHRHTHIHSWSSTGCTVGTQLLSKVTAVGFLKYKEWMLHSESTMVMVRNRGCKIIMQKLCSH